MNDFSLEPQTMPQKNARFTDIDELVGHTILAAFEEPANKNGECAAELVLVTETGCWIAFETESDSCGEDAAIRVIRSWRHPDTQTLHDFVNARALHVAGVINAGELELLAKQEADIKAAKHEARANQLRAQLKALEGGAA